MAVRLVIASVVWTERTLVAWSVSRWAGSTAALMDDRSAELRAALTAVTSAVEMVLVKVVQMDAWLVVHWVASMVASRVVMLVVWKDALLVVAKVDEDLFFSSGR